MLTIKCSKCKSKLMKYHKIGKGRVLKCHKSRIQKIYELKENSGTFYCNCENIIGKDEGSYIKMISNSFIYTGTKEG